MKSKFLPALAVLVGTAVGAGFLGIPYVISRAGFLPGLGWLVFVTFFMLLTKLYMGEISLRTRGSHQLTGYCERYLGKIGKAVMFFAMIFGIYAALIAYLIAEGKSFSYMFFGHESFSLYFSLGFWLVLTFLSHIGLRALKRYEKIAMFLVFGLIALIFIIFSGGIRAENLSYINPENIFMPFGVILFSFLAFTAIPEVKRIIFGQEKLMKKVIFWGVMIPFALYLMFTIVVVGNFGLETQDIATLSLGRVFSILAILTMFTAYFSLTICIRDMFRFDYQLGRFSGWILASFVPLFLFLGFYFFKLASFISLLSIAGVVAAGLDGILILLMARKAKSLGDRTPEYSIPVNWLVIALLSAIFVLAVIAEFAF